MIEQVRFNARATDPEVIALIQSLSDSFRQLNTVLAMQPGIRVNVDRQQLVNTSAAAGGMLAWKNTQESDIIVVAFMVDIVTPGGGGLSGDFGHAATAGTLSDNLLDGLVMSGAARVTNSCDTADAGTNGKASQRIPKGEFITGSVATGNPTGLIAFAHIAWIPILS
jgi:hypothetical protein